MKVHHYDSIPEITQIGEKLFTTPIPQPFYTPNNIYVLMGKEPALIDSGYIQNLGLLQRSLRKIGLSLSNIKHIFYTHNHWDHLSAMMTIRYYTDAKLYGMAGMAAGIGNYIEYMKDYHRAMRRLIYKAHRDPETRKKELNRLDKGHRESMAALENADRLDPVLNFDVDLVEGDVISIGDREIGFLHTPGHNLWHLSPYILGEGIYFSGDLVLENISSVYAEVDGNLSDYHASLNRMMKLPIRRLLPAHGKEPSDPKRAIKLISKTLALMERGVMRRLKEEEKDLHALVVEAMGEKVAESGFYNTALAIIHSIISRLQSSGHVGVNEVDPPYEKYFWTGKVEEPQFS